MRQSTGSSRAELLSTQSGLQVGVKEAGETTGLQISHPRLTDSRGSDVRKDNGR